MVKGLRVAHHAVSQGDTAHPGRYGVYVSNWRLARAVATERPGQTARTVSGTALDVVYVRLLQLGDPGGHARQALAARDTIYGTGIGQKLIDSVLHRRGKAPDARFKSSPMQILHAQNGVSLAMGVAGDASTVLLQLDAEIIELPIATGFAEVWLAKEGHSGNILINFLNKIEVPLRYVMYGAMLAGVDGVIVGAGNPDGLPAHYSKLANHQAVTKTLSVLYQEAGEAFTLTFDPQQIADGAFTKTPLKRPAFLAIVALDGLVQALAESASDAPTALSSSTIPPATTPTRSAPCIWMRWASRFTTNRMNPTWRRFARSGCPSGWPAAMAATRNCWWRRQPARSAFKPDRCLRWPRNPVYGRTTGRLF